MPQFEIKESVYDRKDYTEVYGSDTEKRETTDEYLFDINTSNPLYIDYQPLDSKPEEFVFAKIKSFRRTSHSIRIWAKNQTTSNIYGEYLDNNNNLRKSYFDFIIKFKNGFYLYLEVKGKNDIDKEKTKPKFNEVNKVAKKTPLQQIILRALTNKRSI